MNADVPRLDQDGVERTREAGRVGDRLVVVGDAAEENVAGAEGLIDAAGVAIGLDDCLGLIVEIATGDTAATGFGEDGIGIEQSGWREQIRGDLVVRKGITHIAATSDVASGVWVVELDLGKKTTKIAAELGRGWGDHGVLGVLALVIALVREKEEGAVFAVVEVWDGDGAANRGAELILAKRIAGELEIVAGVELFVAEELPGGAVEGVGAGLRGDVDDAARDLAELGEIVVGLDLELLDVVEDGRVVVVADEGEIVDAIEQEHVAAVTLAADGGEGEAADGGAGEAAATAGVLANGDGADAGGEGEELGEVAAVEREILDGALTDDGAELGGGGVDGGHGGADVDSLRGRADGEGEVEGGGLVDLEGEAGFLEGVEAVLGDAHLVIAGLHVDERERAGLGADGLLRGLSVNVGEGDGGAGDAGAGGIGNGAAEGGGGALGEGRRGAAEGEDGEDQKRIQGEFERW